MTLFGLVVWTAVHFPSVEQNAPPFTQLFVIPTQELRIDDAVEQTAPSRPAVATRTPALTSKIVLPAGELPIDDAAEEARPCSLAVNGGSVDLVVRTLVAQSRLNLVLLGGKATPVTLNLRNVPLIEAVRHLCVLGDLRFVRLPHTLAIGPEEVLKKSYAAEWEKQYPAVVPPAPPEPPKSVEAVVKIVRLAYIPALEASNTLQGIFKDRGLIVALAPRPSVPKLSGVETSSTGATANAGIADTGDASSSRALVLSGSPEVVAAAETLLIGLDTPRAQVQIAVTMHDVSNAALKDLGISWTFNQVNLTERSDRSFLFGTFERTNLGFNAVIRALETNDQARLLASPNVSVLDGERGFVLIGDRLVFPELIGYSQANTPIFSTKQERVGVYLQVSATISPDGYVTMTIAPQVSTVRGFLEVAGTSYPQIATREAQSTLRIKSGQTIVMGGLIRDDEIANMERIPLLADLPILGELFKRRKRSKTTSQLVISVTPTVVAP